MSRLHHLFFILVLILGLIISLPLNGQAGEPFRQYVSDTLRVIPLRAGRGREYKIMTFLPPGAAVTNFAEEDEEWARVSYGPEKEGWILRRYLTSRKPASLLLSTAQGQAEELKKKVDALSSTNHEYRRGNTNLLSEVKKLTKKVKALSHDYNELKTNSAQFLELKEKHKTLLEKYKEIKTVYDNQKNDQDLLKRAYTIKWFLSGAAVILLGIIIGMTIQALRNRRRRSDGLRLR
ncbi:MAG: TIGR04211 family SH3 domain-containing protein [Xanthomonadaceae bacterium]|nr:TIGR04211 family SH3 domain-containing protein [Xanthomonadaceae bacterium]